ncbi:uncharacterized protein LOC122013574 [Zingiber officinale]|uniref:uncharacterized protein LOC122013574 n=1 Tax=Zingiber officinale TaxID=94328 RepID=UPI001C4AFC03|nr:uncharacterized protein LOC122013574 [Zingiber officinale]
MDIPSVSFETMMNTFTQRLIKGEFFQSLIRKLPRDFDHPLRKANEYINMQEAHAARKKETPTEPVPAPERRSSNNHQPPKGPRAEGARPHQEARTHASTTHNTHDCYNLTLIDTGLTPRGYHRRSPTPDRRHKQRSTGRREDERRVPERHHQHQWKDNAYPSRVSVEQNRPSAREEQNRSNAARGEIGMIAGGLTDDDSNRARKSYTWRLEIHAVGCIREKVEGPEISFGPNDLEGVKIPHDDTLIIRVVIANYTIH